MVRSLRYSGEDRMGWMVGGLECWLTGTWCPQPKEPKSLGESVCVCVSGVGGMMWLQSSLPPPPRLSQALTLSLHPALPTLGPLFRSRNPYHKHHFSSFSIFRLLMVSLALGLVSFFYYYFKKF